MRRLWPRSRHLDGEHPSGSQPRCEPWQRLVVVGQPVQHGVGIKEIVHGLRRPIGEVDVAPLDPATALLGCGEHLLREIRPDHLRIRPSLRQDARHLASSTPDVVHDRGIVEPDAGQEFDGGAGSLGSEATVPGRIPRHG